MTRDEVYTTAKAGDEIAVDVDTRGSFLNYRFGKVARVTKTQIEVKIGDQLIKFSKATHKPLQQPGWNDRYRLLDAEQARAGLARQEAYRAVQQERKAIKAEFDRLRDAEWTASILEELKQLGERIKKWNDSDA
jgi:hypothetical protein